jgi:threonine dehydrogenase-like Zn-dependent dehydrogenase
MQATVLYGERDIRFEDRAEPTIVQASDAIIRLPFTCICGSTCGRTAAFKQCPHPSRWAMRTAASSRRSAAE